MRFAYADPPYVGQARKHYKADPRCAEVDHTELIQRLVDEYPDGWALSCSAPSLRTIWALTPLDTRAAPWCKSFHVFKKGVRPAYAWEAVLFRGGRNQDPLVPEKGGSAITPRDYLVAPITLRTGLVGAKPATFCEWVLDLLGFQDGDTLDDLYPGTGIMGATTAQTRIAL